MKVVYSIGAKFAGGGIGTTSYHAVNGLYRHGLLHKLLCSSYRDTNIPPSKIKSMGWASRGLRRLAVHDASRRVTHIHNLFYDRWARRHLERADLFHVWGNYGLRCVEHARAMGSVTIVERASSHPLTQMSILREEHERWAMPFSHSQAPIDRSLQEIEVADYVLIPSDFVRQSFLDHGVSQDKLLQLPFGVDTQLFRPRDRPRDAKSFRVLFVGQLSIQKGLPYLLKAWDALGWSDAELWLVGRATGAGAQILRRYASDTVKHLGYVADPASLYREVDLFAFPSMQEGSALVTYEAMAAGLPVVTTPNAGSVVRHGVEGIIVPTCDSGGLASALQALRADDALRLEMGRAARSRAEEYTWERYGDALARIYQDLVA